MTPIRWAVLGTANIAAKSFLPAMRAAGGEAVVVGTRDPRRAASWARDNRVGRAAGYDEALAADDIDAVYIALPNDQHTTWAARAVATGRAVVCEKPLGVDVADTRRLLDGVAEDALLWESFVFPFHPQTQLIREQLDRLGRVREIQSEFHFTASDPANIRWQAGLAGGALRDVGCYCVRLARLLFDAEVVDVAARAFTAHGVDADVAAVVDFPDDRRLIMSAGMRGAPSTVARVIGDEAELHIANPFHPKPGDTVQRVVDRTVADQWTAGEKLAFQFAVEHVHAVIRGDEQPRHLASTDAPGNAAALELISSAAQRPGAPTSSGQV